MGKKLAKLVDVKSIVTLTLTAVFSCLAIKGVVNGEQFLTIYTTIIAFFFGTKVGRQEAQDEKEVGDEDKLKATDGISGKPSGD